ncbi:hypothetical protein [Caenimonas soli]|uniref:hypothetical protein n=1 Tax=Caenimonas soli TaxID=2735555 RepID=UPI001556132D|nr:hypothetical protein [Caenimonas soli]NPC56678.1 hypothetical protein [Caenimonas soli]
METVCRPGDLAVIIYAQNTSNLGLIVRVRRRDSGRGKLALKDAGPLWTCECAQPMMWTMDDKVFLRKRGPVPDSYMRPIRGDRPPLPTIVARVALETA